MLQREKSSSAYKAGQALEEFARIIDRHGIASFSLDFRCSIRRPEQIDRTSKSFEERTAKLPPPAVLDALADISNDPRIQEEPFDLLRMRIVDLLFIGGFRIGEMLTLPENTLVREMAFDESGTLRVDACSGAPLERIGLRYWPEKGGDPIVKWVPTVANTLVLRAVADIERICREPRENAKWLAEHPGDVQVNFCNKTRLSLIRVAEILGLRESRQKATQWLRQRKRHNVCTIRKNGGAIYVLGADLRRAIATDRYDKAVVTREGRRRQSLSQSLLVIFMHFSSKAKSTNRYISVPLAWQHLSDFLSSRQRSLSIFERLGHLDEHGKPMRVTTHDFRRVLNTIAQRGGLSQVEIARWMGRRQIQDNESYDYRTPADIAAEMRPLVERNEVFGEITKQAACLSQNERDEFIESSLAMVHRTPYGQCGSSIVENPCETAVSCLGGCRHYLRRKGDQKSRARLLEIETEAISSLNRAREAQIAGKYNAQNWVRAQEKVLETVRAALAIDDDPNIAESEIVEISPGGPVNGEPL